ncbi:hypothetical protein EVA_11950 [gut metagenome]|uniref:Uncharacterized protein n=1 Tax=gut metagenome TaxID=749906 RepID=J9FY73_9ZZZZ
MVLSRFIFSHLPSRYCLYVLARQIWNVDLPLISFALIVGKACWVVGSVCLCLSIVVALL